MSSSANRLLEVHYGTSFTGSTLASPPSGSSGSKRPRSSRKSPPARRKRKRGTRRSRYGKSVQEDILLLLGDMDGRCIYHDRDEFRKLLESVFKGMIKFPPYFWEVMMDALSEEE